MTNMLAAVGALYVIGWLFWLIWSFVMGWVEWAFFSGEDQCS